MGSRLQKLLQLLESKTVSVAAVALSNRWGRLLAAVMIPIRLCDHRYYRWDPKSSIPAGL